MTQARKIAKKIMPRKLADLARQIRDERHDRQKESKRTEELADLAHLLSTSQAGQDYWVYGEVFNEKLNGFFLDVGAHDGIKLSNTFLLEKRYGWKGICIEGNPDTFKSLTKHRDSTCVNVCVDREEGEVLFAKRGVSGGIVSGDCDNQSEHDDDNRIAVKTRPLADVLREHDAPQRIDYLTIDIEGAEDRALMSFPFDEFVFTCITIERPSDQLRGRFDENGYVLIKELPGLDCFFVHRSFLDQHHANLIAFHEKSFRLSPFGS